MTLIRSRWAAVGAAVAVTLGAGGLISVNAANDSSSLVPITPARILDTRSGDRVGSLDTAGASDPYRLKVIGTGGIPTSGVTGVSLNVTAVDTRTNDYGGFVSVYPCASVSSTKPDVSNMNFGSGQTVANAVTVPVSADGHICLYVYGTAHLLVDANGYYTQAGTAAGERGPIGATGPAGPQGEQGLGGSELLALATGMQLPAVIDSTDIVGDFTSIAIGDNGYPVISYRDVTNNDLKVAACTSVDCSGTATITTVDSERTVGWFTSIAIGSNGYPIISYYDYTIGWKDLKVAACTTTDCTGTATITTVDTDGDVGRYSSIAIGDNGKPIISYSDSAGRLKVAACTTEDCSSSTIATIDTIETVSAIVGEYSSIAIGTNGKPIVSYYDATNHDLKVAACSSVDCSGTATITTIDSANQVGEWTSIAIGANGKPIVSYYDLSSRNLKVAACTTTDCTGTATITTVDSTGDVGQYTSIAIGATGLPVISYYDRTNTDLKATACTTTDCTGATTFTTISSEGNVGLYTSIAIGATGLPVVAYYDDTNKDSKVVSMWSLLIAN